MATYKELDEALKLAESLSTADQIRELLRKRRGDEGVRISAESKQQLVHRNLAEAIQAKSIDISELFNLIRLSEENGNQHVFYYRPRKRAIVETLSFETVANHLWGASWAQIVASYPLIKLKPNDYKYCDFRQLSERKPKDWILKIYGDDVVVRATGKVEKHGDGTIWREFVEEPLRIVLLARWNNPDLLEVRVQRNESRRRIEEWHNRVWEMLKPAVLREQFDPWVLTKPMGRIVTEEEKHPGMYTFRDAGVIDPRGDIHANFQAFSEQGSLFTNLQTREAITSYLNAKSELRGLTVTWLRNEKAAPQSDLRTLLGMKESHEMIVAGHCLGGDLDYVTDQLRFFGKGSS
jgi:hypothetical protein